MANGIYGPLSSAFPQFRSIGLKDTVKALINEGPPGGMLNRFTLLFDEKAAATDVAADAAMLELGW